MFGVFQYMAAASSDICLSVWGLGILVQGGSHLVLCIISSHCKLWALFSTAVLHRTKGLEDETFTVLSSESHSGLNFSHFLFFTFTPKMQND